MLTADAASAGTMCLAQLCTGGLTRASSNHARIDPFHLTQIASSDRVTDKDSLLGQTLGKPLNLLLGPSVHFLLKSGFSKNLVKSV